MRVSPIHGPVPRLRHNTGWSADGPGEGGGSTELALTNHGKGTAEVFRIS